MTSAGGVAAARSEDHRAGGGSSSTPALHALRVAPIPFAVARSMVEQHHYLHSMPGGTRLALGVFVGNRLLGAITLGVGPIQAYRLVDGARPDDCMTLSRLWLSDELPRNSESRVLGAVIRALGRHTSLKFLVTYADPSHGHVGTIYQATNWLYTGLSSAMSLYDLGDGVLRHSRSLSHSFGTHSVEHFKVHGVPIRTVPQSAKHRYIYFLDRRWRDRLRVPVLPYPRKEPSDGRG